MLKELITKLKLNLKAGKASPVPPIGPALGQYGVNIAQFCKEYNNLTHSQESTIIPVEISIYKDRSYSFILKTSPTSKLILQTLNCLKGSDNCLKKSIGSITVQQVNNIVRQKLNDLNTTNSKQAFKIILGTAKNMGITLIE
jgi:large subunit ribosomal protein L11